MSGKGFDTRKLMTGKDGKLFITLDGVSIWFASVEEFTIGMNFSNVDFHPAGDVQTYGVPDSVKFTASFTEAVVRDDLTIVPMLEAIKNGKIPTFSLQGGVSTQFHKLFGCITLHSSSTACRKYDRCIAFPVFHPVILPISDSEQRSDPALHVFPQ